MIKEKIIEGFENYSVDTEGSVRNVKTGRIWSHIQPHKAGE